MLLSRHEAPLGALVGVSLRELRRRIHRRRLRTVLTRFDVEGDLHAVLQRVERKVVYRVAVEIHFLGAVLENESVPLVPKELADHAATRHGRKAHLMRGPFVPHLLELDVDRLEGRPDRLLERSLPLPCGDRAAWNLDDDEGL